MRTHDAVLAADFDAFVSARGAALWRTALLLTGDAHRAEDLVQTALARSWRHFERVDDFEAYVRRTMLNTYSSWWRRRWRAEIPTLDAGADQQYVDTTADRDLMAALSLLPRGQRAVLVLRYFEGLSEREIAAALDISAGTVKSHASRGLASLRRSPLLQTTDPAETEELS